MKIATITDMKNIYRQVAVIIECIMWIFDAFIKIPDEKSKGKNASYGASRRVIRRYCVSAILERISRCKDYKLFNLFGV